MWPGSAAILNVSRRRRRRPASGAAGARPASSSPCPSSRPSCGPSTTRSSSAPPPNTPGTPGAGPIPPPDIPVRSCASSCWPPPRRGSASPELLGLRWRDVDWGAQRIRVRNAWVRAEHSAEGKSELSTRRSVPMTDRLVGELDRWSRTQYGGERDLVFAHPQSGRPLDRTKVTRRFQGGLRGRRRAAHPLSRPAPHLRHPHGSVRPAAFVADEGRLPPAVRAPD